MSANESSQRLFRAIVPVTDLAKAVQFYAALLESVGQRVSPGRHYFNCQGVILCVYDAVADGEAEIVGPNATPLYFETADLEVTYKRALETGQCSRLGPIALRPWGERSFYATDPFGNALCFVDKTTTFSGQFYVD
jgi:uncharacterized glyoxalase superfamily protein PhnB